MWLRVSPGVLAVYSMRWLQVGRCSLVPLWRTSSTSSSGYWVSVSYRGGGHYRKAPTLMLGGKWLCFWVAAILWFSGTPTEENWPGISSIEEFKSYNFPKYKPQPLINHAPRCRCPPRWHDCCSFSSSLHLEGVCVNKPVGVCSHVCSHECHRQEILFSQTAIHFLPHLSLWLATGRHLTLFCHFQAGQRRHRVAAFIPQSEWSSLH